MPAIRANRSSSTTEPASADRDLPLDVITHAAPRPGAPADPAPAWRRLLRSLRVVPVVMAILMLGGLIGIYFQPPGLRLLISVLDIEPGGGTSNPIAVPAPRKDGPLAKEAAAPPATVAGLGRLLPRSHIITIAPPFGSADARIAELKVDEGDQVTAGALIAVLDNERALQAAAASARATVASREAALRQVRQATIASRDEARAALVRAEATLVNTKAEFDRVTELRKTGFASDAAFDAKRAAHEQAVQDVSRANATLSRYLAAEPDQQPDVDVASRNLDAAQAELERAEAELEKAYVRATVSGTVLTIHARAGEKPGSDGILNLGNLDEMIAEVEVYQTQIGAVTVGAPVTLSADALPHALTGTVSRVGLEVGRQTVTDASPAANTDARVVKVYVALDGPSTETARRLSNLQVTARIATGARQ